MDDEDGEEGEGDAKPEFVEACEGIARVDDIIVVWVEEEAVLLEDLGWY